MKTYMRNLVAFINDEEAAAAIRFRWESIAPRGRPEESPV